MRSVNYDLQLVKLTIGYVGIEIHFVTSYPSIPRKVYTSHILD